MEAKHGPNCPNFRVENPCPRSQCRDGWRKTDCHSQQTLRSIGSAFPAETLSRRVAHLSVRKKRQPCRVLTEIRFADEHYCSDGSTGWLFRTAHSGIAFNKNNGPS